MIRLGIVAESPGDARLITVLGDRLLDESPDLDWITSEVLDAYRTWAGLGDAPFLDVHKVADAARNRGLRAYGHFDGRPGALDALLTRRTLLLFAGEDVSPEVVVFSRDTDGELERVHGFEQALDASSWPFVVISAHADPELEAWQIAIWHPEDEVSTGRLVSERERLGFDPTANPHRLTSGRRSDKKDAKRVLEALCKDPQNLWTRTDLNRFRNAPGVSDFVADFEAEVLPLFGAATGPSGER